MFTTTHLHPMIVHFPIVLIMLGFLTVILALFFFKKESYLSKIGFYLLILGVISTLISWLTGQFFTSEMAGSAGEIKETHEFFATLTLITVSITAIFWTILLVLKKENSKLKWIVFSLYFLATIFVMITGFYGGNLVYNYMMPL